MGEFVEFYANAESESESEDGNDLGVEDFEISDASDEEDEPPKKKTKFSTSKNFIKKKSMENSKNKNDKLRAGTVPFKTSQICRHKKTPPRLDSPTKTCHKRPSKTSPRLDAPTKTCHKRPSKTPSTGRRRKTMISGCENNPKKRKASVPPTKIKNCVSAGKKRKILVKATRNKPKAEGKKKTQNDDWVSGKFTPTLFDFDSSASGLSCNVPQNSSADQLFFFELFFDEKLMDIIVEQTNKYHNSIPVRCRDSNKRKHQKAWEAVDRKEMYVFLATFMLMSAVKKSKMQEYWSKDPLIETPIFRKIIPRDRFLAILRALHFNDNEKQISGDRLYKIRPVMELLKERFSLYINAYKNLAIDESLMLWKGRLCFKQFIASKRHRFGVKLFILCDCETGAILDFIVYTGATTEMLSFNELGISGSIVMTLLQPYLGKGHSIFLDNWYSSPKLYNELHKKRTGACGTVRKNRKEMPQFEKLEKGEIIHLHNDNLMALKWQDKRDVHMLTTLHEPGFAPTKKKNYKNNENIWKPLGIIDYNANMGPIDKSDMQISFSECVRKSVKWYKKFFFHLVDMTVFNCNIMSMMKSEKKCSLGKFRNELVRLLISKYGQCRASNERTVCGSSTPNPKRLIDRHFASKVPSGGGSRLRTRTCFVCSHTKKKQKKRSSSRFECEDCNVGLCIPDCFKEYHTLLHF